MSRYHSYINSAKTILASYDGKEPFAAFLKKYFSLNKKFGSKDRKQVSHLCYCYFRLGKALTDISLEDKILVALFFCAAESNHILSALRPEWNSYINVSLQDKCAIAGIDYPVPGIFPWPQELSTGIDFQQFCESFFVQPDLFLRLRPGREGAVTAKLKAAGIGFTSPIQNCIALTNAVKIDELLSLNSEAVIQDMSSQKTGQLLASIPRHHDQKLKVWDCCTASGGKAIMAVDILGDIELTVSDIRQSILYNLEKRFAAAGIENYKAVVADLSKPGFAVPFSDYDLIIADVPCTGSGTWGRTPEQLFCFNEYEIGRYASLQKNIAGNAIPFLKPGGCMLYITCSVFKEENEAAIDYLVSNFSMQVKEMKVIKGYDKKADTMFVALLRKS